jgi:hypothetical protein
MVRLASIAATLLFCLTLAADDHDECREGAMTANSQCNRAALDAQIVCMDAAVVAKNACYQRVQEDLATCLAGCEGTTSPDPEGPGD